MYKRPVDKSQSVSLPMYDFPEVRAATDAWWNGIARHLQHEGIEVSAEESRLLHDRPVRDLWTHENLLMSQCCGFDVAFGYRDVLSVLVIPVYAVAGCEGGHYVSRVVVHEDSDLRELADLRGTVAAINGLESHSGMNSFMSLVQPLSEDGQFFSQIKISGAHADSISMIQRGEVDVAAIDCVTYALLERYRPEAVADLVTIALTDRAPALPYVTRKTVQSEQQQQMRTALLAAFSDPALADVRETLLIESVLVQPPEFYPAIADNFSFDKRLLDVVV